MKSHKSEVAVTFIYTNQDTVSVLEKTQANYLEHESKSKN